MKLFVRTSAFFAAVLIATGTIAGVGQANAQTNPLESQIRAILDANPEIVVNALNKHQANQQRMQADQLAASARPVAEALIKGDAEVATVGNPARSEEHTSELQSLMRISYDVFCLQTKNNHNLQYTHHIYKTQ